MNGSARVRLEAPAHFDAVDLRHHHVEQDQVGQMLLGGGERLLAVGRLQQFVAVHFQPRDQDVAVGLVVVDDRECAAACAWRYASEIYFRNSLIFASNWRGL